MNIKEMIIKDTNTHKCQISNQRKKSKLRQKVVELVIELSLPGHVCQAPTAAAEAAAHSTYDVIEPEV
jgi:hypothetical protein